MHKLARHTLTSEAVFSFLHEIISINYHKKTFYGSTNLKGELLLLAETVGGFIRTSCLTLQRQKLLFPRPTSSTNPGEMLVKYGPG